MSRPDRPVPEGGPVPDGDPETTPPAPGGALAGIGRAARITRQGSALAEIDAVLETLSRLFASAGYRTVAPPHLYPAELLLDLYGEDLHARAYLFPEGGYMGTGQGGPLCLRPDFTVPVALAHAHAGWERAAKYAYRGPVFRRQAPGSGRPVEYLQAGIENIGALDPAAAEAQVLSLTLSGLDALGAVGAEVVTGDLGIVFALLDALSMPEALRARLRRHLWRPARFQALIEEARRPASAPTPARAALIAAAAEGPAALARLAERGGEILGLREVAEIAERAGRLAAVDPDPALGAEQAALITQVLRLRGESGDMLSALRSLTVGAGIDLAPQAQDLGDERRLFRPQRRVRIDGGEAPGP
ncbi:MAG: ATP phosphoribosyltransferase regulatory subunit, partial [Pseudomonadota bacterium]